MLSMRTYNPIISDIDPIISLKIPSDILRDLVRRSEENGSSVDAEFAIRLARSLERDFEMIENDNAIVLKAFNLMQG